MTPEAHDGVVNRGNSIIAGVVLVGILGSLSIALQATAPDTKNSAVVHMKREAQVAQVTQPKKMVSGSIPKAQEKPQEIGCFENFTYVAVTGKDGQIKTSCEQEKPPKCRASFSTGINSKEAYEKAGVNASCIKAVNDSAQGNSSLPSCKPLGAEQCELIHCFADPKSKDPNDPDFKGCVSLKGIKNGFDAKQGFAPTNNQGFGLKKLIDDAAGDNEKAKVLLKELNADTNLQQGIKNAFAERVVEQEQLVKETSFEQRCAIAEYCAENDKEGKARHEEEKKKLAALQAMQKDLGLKQTGEVGPPCPAGYTCTKGTPDNNNNNRNNTDGGNGGNRGSPSPSGQQGPQGGRQASTFPPQQQQQNPFQQCSPQYFCQNNALYWGSPQQQQQTQPTYNFFTGSYTYPQQCQNQFVQACQYGCEQQQGTQYSTRCAQNPQQQTPTTPVASLSCGGENAIFDVGVTVPITFSCTNSVSSTGNGFSTGGTLTGSVSAVVQKPPAGADIVSYGLTCTASNNQTASKRCDAKINVTTIVVVANPKSVQANASTTIGWVTRGMKTCVISSPNAPSGSPLEAFNRDNADIKNVSGVAVTPPLSADTEFQLSCVTKADQPKSSIIRVRVGS